MEKEQISEQVSWFDIETDIDTVIEKLQDIREEYSGRYNRLFITLGKTCGCRYDCSCSPDAAVMGDRLENDGELSVRMQRKLKYEEHQAERERKEYERLRAKFGD